MRAEITFNKIKGVKTVKITRRGFQGFSIDTNANLPQVHRMSLGAKFSMVEPSIMGREIRRYVKDFGTLHQNDLLGL